MTNFETLTPEIIAEYWSENVSEVDSFSFWHCPLKCPAWSFCKTISIDNGDYTKTCKENFLLWLKSESKN